MEYGVKTLSAFVSFAILSAICLAIDHFTNIEWHKMMAVIALWYACAANVGVSLLQEGLTHFANELVKFLAKNIELKDETPN